MHFLPGMRAYHDAVRLSKTQPGQSGLSSLANTVLPGAPSHVNLDFPRTAGGSIDSAIEGNHPTMHFSHPSLDSVISSESVLKPTP